MFTRSGGNVDIYAFEAGREPDPWFASSLFDSSPSFSADGRRVAFNSERSGEGEEIPIADFARPETAHQLTHRPSRRQGSPSWSPDGHRVVFDSKDIDGHWHIWAIDADGGSAQQMTNDAGDQNVPSWSSDGRYIYFTADHGSGRNLWRIPSAGGPEERDHVHGHWRAARLTIDGTAILYQGSNTRLPLLIRNVRVGSPRQVAACVEPNAFADTLKGIF